MHKNELNPLKTLIALSAFAVILLIGFLTMHKPVVSYHLDIQQSLKVMDDPDVCFYPWQLNSVISGETKNVVLFDLRDHFVFGQGHIPGAQNLSAQDLSREESIKKLEALKNKKTTVVLYGDDQLQANGPVMLFRQVGFDNVKVLAGGYGYYARHKDNLLASRTDSTLIKDVPRYNFAKMAAPQDGTAVPATAKKPVEMVRRQKSKGAAGGC
jgi:rhodanese-related sulfurtransferase